jgi:Tfp pilus assembly protein PilF
MWMRREHRGEARRGDALAELPEPLPPTRVARRGAALALMLSSLALLCMVPAGAAAQSSDEQARLHSQVAASYYQQADYESALREFHAAYRLSQRAQLFFNMSLCYQQLGDLDEAIAYLERYLAKVTEIENRPSLEQRLGNLRSRRDQHASIADPAEGAGSSAPDAGTTGVNAPSDGGDSTNVRAELPRLGGQHAQHHGFRCRRVVGRLARGRDRRRRLPLRADGRLVRHRHGRAAPLAVGGRLAIAGSGQRPLARGMVLMRPSSVCVIALSGISSAACPFVTDLRANPTTGSFDLGLSRAFAAEILAIRLDLCSATDP